MQKKLVIFREPTETQERKGKLEINLFISFSSIESSTVSIFEYLLEQKNSEFLKSFSR